MLSSAHIQVRDSQQSMSRLLDYQPHPMEHYILKSVCDVPGSKHHVSRKDVYIILMELICLAIATLTIFWSRIAVFLGQVDQLIVIGFLLAIMSLVPENQVKSAALMLAGARSGDSSTIQVFDALMRKDVLAAKSPLGVSNIAASSRRTFRWDLVCVL
jgi:hypothetical protein